MIVNSIQSKCSLYTHYIYRQSMLIAIVTFITIIIAVVIYIRGKSYFSKWASMLSGNAKATM